MSAEPGLIVCVSRCPARHSSQQQRRQEQKQNAGNDWEYQANYADQDKTGNQQQCDDFGVQWQWTKMW